MNTQFLFEGRPYVALNTKLTRGPSKVELHRLFREVHAMSIPPDDFHHPQKFRFIFSRDTEEITDTLWIVKQDHA